MLHVELDRNPAHHPYYLQILEQIRSSILAGELAAGSQLPPSRQLAIELGIARRTVTIAYEELCAQGYCLSRVGRGTVVAPIVQVNPPPPDRSITGLPQWLTLAEPQQLRSNRSIALQSDATSLSIGDADCTHSLPRLRSQ
jgi:GntR family transcriptional regulator / MocR family aminotransferase